MIIALETADTRRRGTTSITTFSRIFINTERQGETSVLNDTEREVLDLIKDNPDFVRMGRVSGYPESMFNQLDLGMFSLFGTGTRIKL